MPIGSGAVSAFLALCALLSCLACSSNEASSGGSVGGNAGSTGASDAGGAVDTDCNDYCLAQHQLSCYTATAEACLSSCRLLVAGFGPCGDTWRAAMRCLSAGNLRCSAGSPAGTSACANQLSAVMDCANEHPDAGIEIQGSN